MGGRGSSSGISGLKDSLDFNVFVRENMSNPDFKQFGRENGMDAVKDLWYKTRFDAESKNLHEMSKEDAIATVAGNIPENIRDGWFRNADSSYKPKLIDAIASNPGTFNAGLNIAYHNYKSSTSNPMSFNEWVNTPQTMYRGTRGQSRAKGDVFDSYTPDKKVAQSFGSNIKQIRVKPKNTWGSYQTTGEQEFLIPNRRK